MPENITPIFLPSRAPELNPVENVWQYLRQNWISNTVFENYDAIVDAACDAWRKLTAKPETITSIVKAGNSTSFPRLERRAMVSAVCLPRLGDNSRRVSRRVLMDLKRLFPQHPSARDRIPSAGVQ
jgi:hypothetical protein